MEKTIYTSISNAGVYKKRTSNADNESMTNSKLITTADISAYMGKDLSVNDIAAAEIIIPAVLEKAFKYMGVRFDAPVSTTPEATEENPDPQPTGIVTEYFDAPALTILPKYAVSSVQQLAASDEVLTENEDYFVDEMMIRFNYQVTGEKRSIALQYIGVSTLPPDVKLALIEWVVLKLNNRSSAGKAVKRLSIGTYSADYAVDENAIPAEVTSVLDQYVRQMIV